MKTLLAIGDSFTYGEELADIRNAWPHVLGNKLGYQVINKGIPASCNYRMLRCLVEQDLKDIDLVVIGWSHFDRVEVSDEEGTYEIWPGGNRTKQRTQAAWRGSLIDYFSRHHNDDYLYRQYLLYIILSQSHLIANNKPYIMLDAFGNHKDPRRHSVDNQDLLRQVDITRFLGWPNESMLEWTIDCPTGNKWPILRGPGGHFLDEGHAIVANKIYDSLTKNNLI
jgi:hypothetical protein